MKKIIFLVAFLTLGLIACKQDNKRNVNVTQDDKTGILHNQILDTVFNDLWKAKLDVFKRKQLGEAEVVTEEELLNQKIDLAYDALERGLKNVAPEISDADIAKNMSKDRFNTIAKQNKMPLMRSSLPDSAIQKLLTPFQKQYYKKLMDIVHSKNMTLDKLLVQVSELEKEIINNAPTSDEAEKLLSVTSVARYSAQYWAKKMLEWRMLDSKIVDIIKQPVDTINKIAVKSPPKTGLTDRMPPGYYPYPGYPEYYLYASPDNSNEIMVLKCPDGLVFDTSTCTCNFRNLVKKISNVDDDNSTISSK
jgi:hypothetical protein